MDEGKAAKNEAIHAKTEPNLPPGPHFHHPQSEYSGEEPDQRLAGGRRSFVDGEIPSSSLSEARKRHPQDQRRVDAGGGLLTFLHSCVTQDLSTFTESGGERMLYRHLRDTTQPS